MTEPLDIDAYVRYEERFWSKVEFGACWVWVGASSGTGGYGGATFGGKHWMAHRWAYEFCVGAIPSGLQIDHLCRNPRCVRPDHLEPVTAQENSLRAARKQTCRNGHILEEGNLMGRTRACRECNRKAQWRRRIKRGQNVGPFVSVAPVFRMAQSEAPTVSDGGKE